MSADAAIDFCEERSLPGFQVVRRDGLSSLELSFIYISFIFHFGAMAINWLGRNPLPALCPLNHILGIPCPMCGSTRAFCALDGGDFLTAWALNPMSTLAGILLLVFLCYLLVSVITRRALTVSPAVRKWTFWLVVAGFAFSWVFRLIHL